MYYLNFLKSLHEKLAPETYLEIGVALGKSLAISRCRSVGIDPLFHIQHAIDGDFALVRSTSDEYFARPDPLTLTGGRPFDLSFIDGLHILEFAFRDFIHAEQHATATSIIVFDDVLPRTVDEAARDRHTKAWTGDVFWILEILSEYRPDLIVLPVDTQPTGLLLVVGLDPANRVLTDNFQEILSVYRRPDPQQVPEDILDRLTVMPPQRILESGLVELLRDRRGASPAQLRDDLGVLVRNSLGAAFTSSLEPVSAE